jgi:hypothetical protein
MRLFIQVASRLKLFLAMNPLKKGWVIWEAAWLRASIFLVSKYHGDDEKSKVV